MKKVKIKINSKIGKKKLEKRKNKKLNKINKWVKNLWRK